MYYCVGGILFILWFIHAYSSQLWHSRLDQYAIAKFAESFEMVPKTLAENAGLNAVEIVSSLYEMHADSKRGPANPKVGLDLDKGVCADVSSLNIWDLYLTK